MTTVDETEAIAIHPTPDSSDVVKFIPVSKLPKTLQAIWQNGDIHGAHLQEGRVLVQDRWGELHETNILI